MKPIRIALTLFQALAVVKETNSSSGGQGRQGGPGDPKRKGKDKP